MTDLEFIQRCVSGQKPAWSEFVDKYSRLIYHYIHSVLASKGAPEARENIDDLFQDIFVLLCKDDFRKLKSFQGKNGCSLASWLRMVTINFTIDYLRKDKPLLSLEQEDEDGFGLMDILEATGVAACDSLVAEEKITSLTDCIAGLSQDDKYFLKLHLQKGLSPEQLSVYLGIERSAVDMRKSRIVERLRECFKGKGFVLDF